MDGIGGWVRPPDACPPLTARHSSRPKCSRTPSSSSTSGPTWCSSRRWSSTAASAATSGTSSPSGWTWTRPRPSSTDCSRRCRNSLPRCGQRGGSVRGASGRRCGPARAMAQVGAGRGGWCPGQAGLAHRLLCPRPQDPSSFGGGVSVRKQQCPENGLKMRLAVYYEWAFNEHVKGMGSAARDKLVGFVMARLSEWGVKPTQNGEWLGRHPARRSWNGGLLCSTPTHRRASPCPPRSGRRHRAHGSRGGGRGSPHRRGRSRRSRPAAPCGTGEARSAAQAGRGAPAFVMGLAARVTLRD